MRKAFTSSREEGQAVVEYILMLVFAMVVVGIITTAFRKSVYKTWVYYIRQISPACPGCEPNPTYRYQ